MSSSLLSLARAALIGLYAMVVMNPASAQTSPDVLVRQISAEVLDAARSDISIRDGDAARIFALVESKVMPHVNFEQITRSAVGPKWREATPEQRDRLQAEFKTLLIRIYARALSQVQEQTIEVTRTVPSASGSQVVVQTEIRGRGEAIKLDYRLEQSAGAPAWKLIDVNVGGLWLVQNYRSQFAPELAKAGVDGLIERLVERNKAAGRP